jgi:hypothetical protein
VSAYFASHARHALRDDVAGGSGRAVFVAEPQ